MEKCQYFSLSLALNYLLKRFYSHCVTFGVIVISHLSDSEAFLRFVA